VTVAACRRWLCYLPKVLSEIREAKRAYLAGKTSPFSEIIFGNRYSLRVCFRNFSENSTRRSAKSLRKPTSVSAKAALTHEAISKAYSVKLLNFLNLKTLAFSHFRSAMLDPAMRCTGAGLRPGWPAAPSRLRLGR
jgi:hypothetical protein